MLKPVKVVFGSDPEAFFQKNGEIIGSEKLIPRKGLQYAYGKIVRDGVQFELHPNPGTIRELADSLGSLINTVNSVAGVEPGVSINYNGLVEVSREELDSLSQKSRVLGCQPSHNIYGAKPIDVDTVEYRKRSSGGHIHLGLPLAVKRHASRIVPVLDRLVGNTCVLLDRDPGAAERRENYGRAGECRFPKHGLEYRTTSNFWLRDPVLLSFVFGMAQLSVSTVASAVEGKKEAWTAFTSVVSDEHVIAAINTNDFSLAMQNFNALAPVLRNYLPKSGFPLTPTNIGAFVNFAVSINRNGLESVFSEANIQKRWAVRNKQFYTSFIG